MKEGNENNKIIQTIILCVIICIRLNECQGYLKTDRLYDKQIVIRKDEICRRAKDGYEDIGILFM